MLPSCLLDVYYFLFAAFGWPFETPYWASPTLVPAGITSPTRKPEAWRWSERVWNGKRPMVCKKFSQSFGWNQKCVRRSKLPKTVLLKKSWSPLFIDPTVSFQAKGSKSLPSMVRDFGYYFAPWLPPFHSQSKNLAETNELPLHHWHSLPNPTYHSKVWEVYPDPPWVSPAISTTCGTIKVPVGWLCAAFPVCPVRWEIRV